jgi:hypothetical protein
MGGPVPVPQLGEVLDDDHGPRLLELCPAEAAGEEPDAADPDAAGRLDVVGGVADEDRPLDRVELVEGRDAENSKPDPDILVATLDKLEGVERAILVGDTPYDVEAAARIGLGCVGLLTGGFSRAELEEAGAVAVVEDLTELRDWDWSAHLKAPRAADGEAA